MASWLATARNIGERKRMMRLTPRMMMRRLLRRTQSKWLSLPRTPPPLVGELAAETTLGFPHVAA